MKSERLDVVLNEQGEATGLVGYAAFDEMKSLMAEADVWNGGFTADGKITLIRVEIGWAYWGSRHRSPPQLTEIPIHGPHTQNENTHGRVTPNSTALTHTTAHPGNKNPQEHPTETNSMTNTHQKPTCWQVLPRGITDSGKADVSGNRP